MPTSWAEGDSEWEALGHVVPLPLPRPSENHTVPAST